MKRIALVLILGSLVAPAAFASDSTAVEAPRADHRARMEKAIEARDYDAWKAERESWGAKGRYGQKVTKANFETFARMHDAMKAGRTDEATALRLELGMGEGRGGMGGGNGMCDGKGGRHGKSAGQGAGANQGAKDCHRQK